MNLKKKCPWCLGDARVEWEPLEAMSEDDTDRAWFGECQRCGARGPTEGSERGAETRWEMKNNLGFFVWVAQNVPGLELNPYHREKNPDMSYGTYEEKLICLYPLLRRYGKDARDDVLIQKAILQIDYLANEG